MNRDIAEELVLRAWPTDQLRFFVDGYILALEDVLKDYKMYEEHGLVTEGYVNTLIESVRSSLDQARDTKKALLDRRHLDIDLDSLSESDPQE